MPRGAPDFQRQQFQLHRHLQFGQKGRDAAIDLGADRIIADVRMHRIGKVDGCRPARQSNQAAFGCEAEHLIVEELELGVFQKFFR